MLKKLKKIAGNIKNRFLYYKGANPMKIIITGPPRSGTSFLAGLVVKMGLSPGPKEWLKEGDKNNPYGYYECMPLMEIDHSLLKKFGGGVIDPPDLPENWIELCGKEKKQIRKIVEGGGIEVYKGNMLIVLADLYAKLFPDAKWIMIYRNEKETARSIRDTGTDLSSQKLIDTRKKWIECWEKTRSSSNCLTIKYEDFFDELDQTIKKIVSHLDLSLSEEIMKDCVDFFRPRESR